jgi:hypothetical protein
MPPAAAVAGRIAAAGSALVAAPAAVPMPAAGNVRLARRPLAGATGLLPGAGPESPLQAGPATRMLTDQPRAPTPRAGAPSARARAALPSRFIGARVGRGPSVATQAAAPQVRTQPLRPPQRVPPSAHAEWAQALENAVHAVLRAVAKGDTAGATERLHATWRTPLSLPARALAGTGASSALGRLSLGRLRRTIRGDSALSDEDGAARRSLTRTAPPPATVAATRHCATHRLQSAIRR